MNISPKNTDFSTRQASVSDLSELVPLFDAYRMFYGKDSDLKGAEIFLQDRMKKNESVIFFAKEGKKTAGFVQLYPSFSSVSIGKIFVLNDLFVQERFRKMGAGEMLIQKAVEYARSENAVRLVLSTGISNQSAQRLYEKLGWEKDVSFFYYSYSL